MNEVILIGRLTKDPELRYTQSQTPVCNMAVAIDRGKDKNGNDQGADFPRVIVFGRQGENCSKYLEKGRQVAIRGHIRTGSYQDKDGKTVYTTDVVADRVEFIGGNGQAMAKTGTYARAENTAPAQQEYEGFEAISEEDVPF